MGERATPQTLLKQETDVVVVATGGIPERPGEFVLDGANVVFAWDVLKDGFEIGPRVLVIGAGGTGLETAAFLASRRKRVTIVEMLDRCGRDMEPTMRFYLKRKLDDLGVQIMTSVRVRELGANGIKVSTDQGDETWTGFDTVVLATGVRPRTDLLQELNEKIPEIHIIGDAAKPRKASDAVREGAETGISL